MKIVKACLFTTAFGEILIKAITDEGYTAFIPDENSDVPIWRDFIEGGGVIGPEEPEPAPVPESISDRQFAQQLATAGMITNDEALAWVATGTLPEAFTTFVSQLPAAQRFAAQMLLTGATIFERSNPLTDAFGAMYGMNSEQIDDLWRAASQL